MNPGSKLGPQGAPATTPTYTPRLNQVERRFGIITRMASSFSSFREPAIRIEPFVEYNPKATPFRWTATAASILAKVQRFCVYISGTQH